MASELQIVHPTSGNTLYVIVRRKSDGKVWNGSSFETWADGSIGNYDVALTSQGGDLWTGDFPSGISAGRYIIMYYLRAGGSPATSDKILASREQQWDGAGLTDSSVTLSQYALTTLGDLKTYMNISATTYDSALTLMINAMSDRIERLAGHKFKARNYRHRVNGRNSNILPLPEYPIISVNRLAYGTGDALRVSYSGSAIRATISVTDSLCRLYTISSTGTATTSDFDLTSTSYDTVSELATAIAGVSGYSATVIQNIPSQDLNFLPGVSLKDGSRTCVATLTYPDRSDVQYSLDTETGVVMLQTAPLNQYIFDGYHGKTIHSFVTDYGRNGFMDRGHKRFLVEYRAGYETIPDDLAQVCRELVSEAFNLGRKDPSVKSESLGDYSYTLADTVQITEGQKQRIAQWSKLAVGAGAT